MIVPRSPADEGDDDGLDTEVPDAPPRADRAERNARPRKPRVRDWLEERCRREAMIYSGAIVLLGPLVLAAVLFTWWLLLVIVRPWVDGTPAFLLATALLVGLFWLNRLTRGEARTAVRVDAPDGPRKLAIPALAGMTWLHDLTGRQEGPLALRTAAGLVLMAPRLCEMLWTMGTTSRRLWTLDADRVAPVIGTVLRADGKALFRTLLDRYPRPRPAGPDRRPGAGGRDPVPPQGRPAGADRLRLDAAGVRRVARGVEGPPGRGAGGGPGGPV